MVLRHHEIQAWPPLVMNIKTLVVFNVRRHRSARKTQAPCRHPAYSRLQLDEKVLGSWSRNRSDHSVGRALITLHSNKASKRHADILVVQLAAPIHHHQPTNQSDSTEFRRRGSRLSLLASGLTQASGKSNDVPPFIPKLWTEAAMMKSFDRDRAPLLAR
jgi:hypothetical protein